MHAALFFLCAPQHTSEKMDRRMLRSMLLFEYFFLLLSPEIIEIVIAQRNYDVRVAGGPNNAEGRVEIYYNRVWGTVCDDGWGVEESKVVCRQLGFNRTDLVPETFTDAAYGKGAGRIWLDDVSCTGAEAKLSMCSHRDWGKNDCSHSEDVGVRCPEGADVTEGSLRIIAGTTMTEGRLEIYHDQKWGTVCDDNWDTDDGDVACRQLGFKGINKVNPVFNAVGGLDPIWMDEVSCGGSELTLSSCDHNGWENHDCTHSEDVGLRCLRSSVHSGSLRLVDGVTENEGRVEILYDGEWGTVCDNGWEINDGTVACKQLGFPGADTVDVTFRHGTGTIWLDSVQCQGTEQSLAICSHGGWGVTNQCRHSNDAAVRCTPEDLAEGEVRLIDGLIKAEGRVEIFHHGEWGTVCDDSWDWTDAEVVCRQLGYQEVDTVYDNAHFGEGFGRIWMDDLECRSSELTLSDCSHPGWGIENCEHSEDAGVRCSYEGDTGAVRLVNGPSEKEGLLEIYYDLQWGTVCDDSFDAVDSQVVCEQLGFTGSSKFFTAADKGYRVQDGSIPIWLESVNCEGNEPKLSFCSHNGWGRHDCSHPEDIAIQCSVKGGGLSGGAIAGIVIGSLLGVFCCYCCCCRNKKHKTPAQDYNVPIDPTVQELEDLRADDAQETNPTPPTAPGDNMTDLPPPSYDDIANYTSCGQPEAEAAYPPTASAPYPPESLPNPPAVSPPPSFEAASAAYPYPPSGDEGVAPSAPPMYPPS